MLIVCVTFLWVLHYRLNDKQGSRALPICRDNYQYVCVYSSNILSLFGALHIEAVQQQLLHSTSSCCYLTTSYFSLFCLQKFGSCLTNYHQAVKVTLPPSCPKNFYSPKVLFHTVTRIISLAACSETSSTFSSPHTFFLFCNFFTFHFTNSCTKVTSCSLDIVPTHF